MEASAKIKSLLDELAAVLAEMGTLQEEPSEDTDLVEENAGKEPPVAGEESDEVETPEEDVMADEEKEKKLRCLCERAEKLREKVTFYEGVAAKELELRAVLDKSTPAGESAVARNTSKEGRSVQIYSTLPGAGRLKNFKGPNAEERAYRAGQFFKASLLKDQNAARWCADHGVVEGRALAEGVNSTGGVFLSEEVLNEVIVLVEEFGAFPANARNISMKSDTLVIPRRTGGLKAYFIGENTLAQDSDAAWDRVQLVCKKVAVSNRMSSEVLEDSVLNLADYIVGEISRSVAELVDTVGFVGNGSGDHGGIIGAATKINDGAHNGSVVTAASGNNSALTLDVDDLIATAGRLPIYARSNAKWFVNPAVFAASVQRLGLVNNTGLSGGNTAANLAAPAELRLLGYPVVFVQTLSSAVGADPSVVKFLFGDLSMSSIYATRRGLTVRTSTERYAELDQTLIVATTRFDCTTSDCGSADKAGPIVALKTAA
jgi:HK97 family phage major capsid protein